MKNLIIILLVLFVAVLSPGRALSGQGIKVAEDTGSFIIGKPIDEFLRGILGVSPAGKRRITKIEVIRVIPRRGNNPLNTREPIKNTFINGQVVYTAVDELEKLIADTSVSPGNYQSCIGTVTFEGSFGFYNASIKIDPVTRACTLASGSNGETLIVSTPVPCKEPFCTNPPPGDEFEAFPDFFGGWEFSPPIWPSPVFLPGTQQTFTLKATNGLTVEITLTVTVSGPTSFQLTVISIKEV